MDDHARKEQRIREKLAKYKDWKEFLKEFEDHQTMHEARSILYREEGFRDLNDKFGADYNIHVEAEDPESKLNERWHIYKEQSYNRYWDTKDNAAYYSQPMSTRAWLTFKKVIDFYRDFLVLWLFVAGSFVVFNALVRSKKMR